MNINQDLNLTVLNINLVPANKQVRTVDTKLKNYQISFDLFIISLLVLKSSVLYIHI